MGPLDSNVIAGITLLCRLRRGRLLLLIIVLCAWKERIITGQAWDMMIWKDDGRQYIYMDHLYISTISVQEARDGNLHASSEAHTQHNFVDLGEQHMDICAHTREQSAFSNNNEYDKSQVKRITKFESNAKKSRPLFPHLLILDKADIAAALEAKAERTQGALSPCSQAC